MSGAYTRELSFAATGGEKKCVVLPAHPRGVLEKLFIKQTGGTGVAYDFKVLDRKGACETEIDLHVSGGGVAASADNGGKAQFETDAAHNRQVGDRVYIKGTGQATYDGAYHEIISIESTTEFTTDTAHAAVVSAGYWQTEPLDEYPILDPDIHEVYSGSEVADATHKGTGLGKDYTNRDNQDLTARKRAQALYLEFDPDGSGAQTWVVSVTTTSDHMV